MIRYTYKQVKQKLADQMTILSYPTSSLSLHLPLRLSHALLPCRSSSTFPSSLLGCRASPLALPCPPALWSPHRFALCLLRLFASLPDGSSSSHTSFRLHRHLRLLLRLMRRSKSMPSISCGPLMSYCRLQPLCSYGASLMTQLALLR